MALYSLHHLEPHTGPHILTYSLIQFQNSWTPTEYLLCTLHRSNWQSTRLSQPNLINKVLVNSGLEHCKTVITLVTCHPEFYDPFEATHISGSICTYKKSLLGTSQLSVSIPFYTCFTASVWLYIHPNGR